MEAFAAQVGNSGDGSLTSSSTPARQCTCKRVLLPDSATRPKPMSEKGRFSVASEM